MKEISGDKPLSRADQIRYLKIFLGRFLGLFARVSTKTFHPEALSLTSASFFRKYIDAFLAEKFSELIKKKEISVFDIGCGSGYVRGILAREGYSGTYTGLDVVRENRFDDHETSVFSSMFVMSPIESYETEPKHDLVLSNTSLEHVGNDVVAVEKAHQACAPGGIEIHIVPSWWSFFLYLWHGYRHYTPGSLGRLFEGTDFEIFRLGGLTSFWGHLFLITIPERYFSIRFRQKSWYAGVAARLIRLDRFLPLCPAGYAIVVRHGTHT